MEKTVVIIDDSRFLIAQIKVFFENNLNFSVVGTGEDGNEAVELYRKHRPDLITLDITMPNRNGEDALREIIEEFPDANVLMISALRGDAMLECMSAGAKGYIEKPLKFSDNGFITDFRETVQEIFS
jgi:two-component system chemotaxis response regulator CheY